MASIKCTKCGAPNELDAGAKFLQCAYCESQIYVDKSGAGFYYILPYQMDGNAAQGIFRRWCAGSERAKDLESAARVVSFSPSFFPVFMFRRETDRGEQVLVEPARSTTLPGLHNLKVPPGDLKVFDQNYDTGGAELMDPNIEMMAYLDGLPGKPKEQALVFFPIYQVEYAYGDRRYIAIIDGSSGEVFSSDYPPRRSGAYVALGLLGFVVCAAAGALLMVNPVGGVALLVVTVIGLFGGGYWVAKNM